MADLILVGQCFLDPDKANRTRKVLNKFTPDVLCIESTKTLHELTIECAKQFSGFLKDIKDHPRYDEIKGIYDRSFGGYDALIHYAGPGFPLFLMDDPMNVICRDNEFELRLTKDHFINKPLAEKLRQALHEADKFAANRQKILIDAMTNYGVYHNGIRDIFPRDYAQNMRPANMSRDVFMEKEIRRIHKEYQDRTILWIGNISRLCEDAAGWTLYSRIQDLHPKRFALDEIDYPDKVE